MTKRDTYEVLASQHYIEFQMSVVQIAKKFNLSEKTIHNWKKAGDWENKRKRYLKSQYSTNQTLYELLHLVSKQAVEDYRADGTLPDQKTLYFIMGMTEKLQKLKAYETQAAKEKIEETAVQENTPSENKTEIAEEVLKTVFDSLIGG